MNCNYVAVKTKTYLLLQRRVTNKIGYRERKRRKPFTSRACSSMTRE